MNFFKTNVLGRGETREGTDLERQTPEVSDRQAQGAGGILPLTRPGFPRLFSGQPNTDGRGPVSRVGAGGNNGPVPSASSSIRSQSQSRPRTPDTSDQPSREDSGQGSSPISEPSRARTRSQRFPVLARPLAARTNGEEPEREPDRRQVRRSWPNGSGPAELRMNNRTTSGRQQKQDAQGRRRKEPPKNFLFCFPWVRSRRARSLILRCFVSGVFLVSMLTVYLALSLSKNINMSEFSILLIILIILTAVFFCHGLVRLCILLSRPRKRQAEHDVEYGKYGSPGYVVPVEPIQVVLARDEEAAGIQSATANTKPPAYGLWRESVRVDPNRIYWQRTGSQTVSSLSSAPSSTDDGEESSSNPRTGLRRPPSYSSDDGIDYVVDARPRSIAPPPSSIYSLSTTAGSPPLPPPLPVVPARGPRVLV